MQPACERGGGGSGSHLFAIIDSWLYFLGLPPVFDFGTRGDYSDYSMENVVCGGGLEGLALAQEGQGAREPATELTALGRDIEHGKRASRGPFGVAEAAERNKTIRIVCVIRECMIVPDSQILGCADHLVKYREVVDSMPPTAWPPSSASLSQVWAGFFE